MTQPPLSKTITAIVRALADGREPNATIAAYHAALDSGLVRRKPLSMALDLTDEGKALAEKLAKPTCPSP